MEILLLVLPAAIELVILFAVNRRLDELRRCHEDLAAAIRLIRRGEIQAARGIVKRWTARPPEREWTLDGQPRPPTRILCCLSKASPLARNACSLHCGDCVWNVRDFCRAAEHCCTRNPCHPYLRRLGQYRRRRAFANMEDNTATSWQVAARAHGRMA
jgi:hypothetical protein